MGKMRYITVLWCTALLFCCSPSANAADVPLAQDKAAADELEHNARSGGKSVYLAKLGQADEGTLFAGETMESLAPGRYRLHAAVAVAPLGNLIVSLVELRLKASQTERAFSVVHFPTDDEFVDFTLDFTTAGGRLPIELTWAAVESEKTKGLKAKRSLAIFKLQQGVSDSAEIVPDGGGLLEEDDQGLGLELDDETSTYTLAEARETPYRMVLGGVYLEQLSPLEVQVHTDKVCYVPGDPGTVTISLINHGQQPVEVMPTVWLKWQTNRERELPCDPVPVPGKGTNSVSLTFDTDDLYWGAEIAVTAAVAGKPDAKGRQVFAVRRNFWETAITAAHPAHLGLFDDPERAATAAADLRKQGFTGFEAFFWGPCDMLEFTPETERWASGQTAYPGSISGTRNLIEACHKEGIFGTVYANLWGGSGPPAMEIQRRHPEWFGNANYNTFVLDDWDLLGPWQDMQDAKLRAPGVAAWCFNQLDIDPPPGVFQHHARELVGTHRMFGWDGVRYDSYYSRYWSVKAMRLIRSIVGEDVPTFGFGYNSFAQNDAKALALDDMIGGGGMIMAEGIRIERTRHISGFVAEMLTWRDIIWAYGGHGPGMIFRDGTDEDDMTPLGIEYQASSILAAGGHLYYNPVASEMANYPQFALRYSEYIYNNRMQPLKDPARVVSFGSDATFLEWQRLARTMTVDGKQRRLVLHLLNPPVAEDPFGNKTMNAPEPQRAVPLTITLPPGAAVTGLWELLAGPDAHHNALPHSIRDGRVVFEVPEVRFWTAIVLDYESDTPLPGAVTLKDKTDSYIQDWYILAPFPNDPEMSAVKTAYPPEEKVDLQAAYEGKDGQKIVWQRLHEPAEQPVPGRPVDFKAAIDDNENYAAGYLYTEIVSERDRKARLFGKADDTIAVWVNGEQVPFEGGTGEFPTTEEGHADIQLNKGTNTVLVKVCEKWLYWLAALRLAHEDGTPMTDGIAIGVKTR